MLHVSEVFMCGTSPADDKSRFVHGCDVTSAGLFTHTTDASLSAETDQKKTEWDSSVLRLLR